MLLSYSKNNRLQDILMLKNELCYVSNLQNEKFSYKLTVETSLH